MASVRLWSRRLADELWSGPVTPLTFDLLADVMTGHLVHRRLAVAGLPVERSAAVLRLHQGRVYVDATRIAGVIAELPAALVTKGLLDTLPEELRKDLRGGGRSWFDPRLYLRCVRVLAGEPHILPWARVARFREVCRAVRHEFEEEPAAVPQAPGEIDVEIGRTLDALGQFLDVASWGVVYAFVFFHLLGALLERWVPGDRRALAQLLRGAGGVESFAANLDLNHLVAELREDESVRRRWLEATPVAIAQAVAAGDVPRHEVLTAFLERHGHRLVARDLSWPTWRERPEKVAALIQRRLREPPGVVPPPMDIASLEQRIFAHVNAGPMGSLRSAIVRMLLDLCRETYALRENMRYGADFFLARLRALALEAGRRAVERGAATQPSDVFWLLREELFTDLLPAESCRRISIRRDEYAHWGRETPPLVIDDAGRALAGASVSADCGPGVTLQVALPARAHQAGQRSVAPETRATLEPASIPFPGAGVLDGEPAAPGRQVGAVRRIVVPDDLDTIERGDVVVALATDPSWMGALSCAGALVLESAGLLSHGAIVARELGIPAVVGVTGALAVLENVERVMVDGDVGRVECLRATTRRTRLSRPTTFPS